MNYRRSRFGRNGEIEFDLSAMQQQYEQLQEIEETFDTWLKRFLLKQGQRLLAMTQLRTPVGEYPDNVAFWVIGRKGEPQLIELWGAGEGKQGGTLRRSWQLTNVRKIGNNFEISVFTQLFYAPYVEHGHRTVHFGPPGSKRTTAGWWEGYHMAKISLEKIQKELPRRLRDEFTRYLQQHWGENR